MKGWIVPGVFSAAGLMVPDPSIISALIPFIGVDTGCEVEYMTSNYSSSHGTSRTKAVAPRCWCAKAPVAVAGSLVDDCCCVQRGISGDGATGAICRMQLSRSTEWGAAQSLGRKSDL